MTTFTDFLTHLSAVDPVAIFTAILICCVLAICLAAVVRALGRVGLGAILIVGLVYLGAVWVVNLARGGGL